MEDLYSKYLACGNRVTTDSRAIEGGEIFFALRGENFDGNNYALGALEKGAAWAVVNEDAIFPESEFSDRLIKVTDPFKALQELAITHRKACRFPVIGLTGTNGKTTTKELINAVLGAKYKVTATHGNLNNDIGVPLSILKITPETEIAVIEMGANHPDDIAKLVKVCQPDLGLITNVGKAHLLGFGSFEGVKAAKGELYKWLGAHKGSVIFLNEDDPDLCGMAAKQPSEKVGYGINFQGAEIMPATADEPFLRIKLGGNIIKTNLVGSYNATNVLAAMEIGKYFNVSFEAASEAIAAYIPTNNRSQMVRTASNMLIVDAYNANPSSMAAALDNFAAVVAERKLALLGDMRELGADSVAEHEKIVRKVIGNGFEAIFVGDEFKKALDAVGNGSYGWFANSDELAAYLAANKMESAAILVKGSRGIQMEKVLKEL